MEQKLGVAKLKLTDLQNRIQMEQDASLAALRHVEEQKGELMRLQATTLWDKKTWEDHELELQELKRQNDDMRRKREEELRVARRVPLPGFAVFGQDIDEWLQRTNRNIVRCCRSFCDDRPLDEWTLQNPPDGQLCQYCGCGVGPHDRLHCKVCRVLDLSDASLLP